MANTADLSTPASEQELTLHDIGAQQHTDGKAMFNHYTLLGNIMVWNIKCVFMFNLEIGTWDDIFGFEDDFPDWSTGLDSW